MDDEYKMMVNIPDKQDAVQPVQPIRCIEYTRQYAYSFVDSAQEYLKDASIQVSWPISIQTLLGKFEQIVYNTEQLTREVMLRNAVHIVQSDYCKEFWDYSEVNLGILKCVIPEHDHYKLKYRPLKVPATRLEQVRQAQNKDKLYDLGFVGTMTPKRLFMLKKLQDAGLSICLIQHFDVNLQFQELGQCRAILNLHAGPDYQVLETSRIQPYLELGLPVLSEISLDHDDRIQCVFYEHNLVEKVKEYLQSLQ